MALVLAAGAAKAQQPAAPLTEVERVRLVLLSASVTDRKGRPVQDLSGADFQLFDDETPQSIGFFATEEEAPIALAFLLDVSNSMKLENRLDQARGAIRTFVEALGPADRVGLIGFADRQVTWVTEFTSDRARFERDLRDLLPRGRTALYDALAASPHLVDEEIRGRRAIVLITDGFDNASESTTLRAVWLARRVNVPIYCLSFIPMRETLLAPRARAALDTLTRFSTETGGALFPVHGPKDLDAAVNRIQAELRFQYVVGFYPDPPVWDGRFRTIRLETLRKGLSARTRAGYYARP